MTNVMRKLVSDFRFAARIDAIRMTQESGDAEMTVRAKLIAAINKLESLAGAFCTEEALDRALAITIQDQTPAGSPSPSTGAEPQQSTERSNRNQV